MELKTQKKPSALAFIAAASSLLVLSGCGVGDRVTAGFKGYSIVCVKETGVEYVQFTSGASPLINRQGQPVPCP